MSPFMITTLVIGGLIVLLAIVYLNHLLENAKLEKARMQADLADRTRRIGTISETLPGQLMSIALKQLLVRLELLLSERLQRYDRQNAGLTGRMAELRKALDQGDGLVIQNAKQAVTSEAKAKEIRYQLEDFNTQLNRAVQDGLLGVSEGKKWANESRHMLVMTYVELFNFLGQQALKQKLPRQARLAFERGVQFLQKQQDTDRYRPMLQQLKVQLDAANALVLDNDQPAADGEYELTAFPLESDDDWKKKTIYD